MHRPLLYVEDEENDVLLLKLAFQRIGVRTPLHIVTTGMDAIDYLSGKNQYADRQQHPVPAAVLLDLNLPVLSGFEVLRWIRQDPAFKAMRVCVFSSSDSVDDKALAKELGADDYIVKPVDMARIEAMVRQLASQWLLEA